MCKNARRKLNELPTKTGNMTTGTKKGLNLVLDEIEKVNGKVDRVVERQEQTDKNVLEILKLVNAINEKVSIGHIEEKAAVVDALSKFGQTKFGKVILFLILVCIGLSAAYIIEHGAFDAIANWAK